MEIIEQDTFFQFEEHFAVLSLKELQKQIDNSKKIISLPDELPEINLKEVSNHDNIADCWIVLYDRVYDVTKFLELHPGGHDIILDYAGRDATLSFNGTGHSDVARKQLKEYLIGELPPNERIFRKKTASTSSTSSSELSATEDDDVVINLKDLPE